MSLLVDNRDRLIIALDVPTVEEAAALVKRIGDEATFYKIGHELLYTGGVDLARRLIGEGKKVFIDAKLHDIGNTVERATANLAALGAHFLTVHAYPQTLQAAARGRGSSNLKILGITVLTSYDDNDVMECGFALSVNDLVLRRAKQILESGVDGVVCAPTDVSAVRSVTGERALLVTPGVRPSGAATGDQKRVATPADAIRAGADHLVVGRPVTKSADPARAAAEIVEEIAAV
ncbi:orotidine 5'-phosphate decarboxylase [Agaricicola taiwanensis]|uniref:Orotidine 5'-phosphate decarboxylase n=1 Tax=Agaricicola taiwanensis TaxID=591372 RepID=A0A8J2VMZ5_9RHOB|nr:orotidine-5'-phosphate decarboxylase [Agaricicola taiwanensis]GGE29724.1 orotidine 5'-phosphate decarboxylase [Agaricicola taiwanensis]